MATQFDQMKKKAAESGKKDFGRIEDGTYPARVVQAIMLGDHIQDDWQTGEPKLDKKGDVIIKPEVWVTYEFPTERIQYKDEDGNDVDRPRWQSKTYVFSMHEKAGFRHMVDAVAPDAGTIADILGKPCTVEISSTKGGKAKVKNVGKPMKGMVIGELENPIQLYDLDEPDQDVFDKLPEFLRDKITNQDSKSEVDVKEVNVKEVDVNTEAGDPFA